MTPGRGTKTRTSTSTEAVSGNDGGSSWANGETTWADEPGIDEARSVGLMVDQPGDEPSEHDDEGEPTLAHPVVEVETGGAAVQERRTMQDLAPGADRAGKAEATSDPFLDELRRVTSDDDDDEALSKFLGDSESDDDGKGGWFGRRK